MSNYETRSKESTPTMVHQLGTPPNISASGEWDKRLVSYIVPPEKIPSSFRPVLYALVRRDVVVNKKRFWVSLADNYLVLVNSIEGRGQNNIIRAENALKGIPVQIEAAPDKPGIIDRIIDRDKVKEYDEWKERKELDIK